MKKQETKPEKRKELPVRTPPDYLIHTEPRSPEYIEACSKYTLVLETDGFGVIAHNT